MKKNRFFLELAILIGTIIPFIVTYFLKGKVPFIEFDKYLKGTLIAISLCYFYPLYIYQKNIHRSFSTKINLWFRLSWLLLSIAFGSIFLIYSLSPTLSVIDKLFFVLIGIVFIIDGNYRGLITKNSGVYMGFVVNSITDEGLYKIAQQKIGRFTFWLGFVMAISPFLLTDENIFFSFYLTVNLIFIVGICWIVYKGNKQAIN